MKQNKTYDQEFKEKVIKEYHETKNFSAVAKSNSFLLLLARQKKVLKRISVKSF